MPTVNNVEHLRRWFRGCPALQPRVKFRVDYLAEEAVEYALIALPSTIRYHENVLGENVPNDIQSVQFIFATKEFYGGDETQNIANFGFYQDVVKWIMEQNDAGNFPRIDGGRVTAIKATLSAYVSEAGNDNARYQIQIEVVYKMVT